MAENDPLAPTLRPTVDAVASTLADGSPGAAVEIVIGGRPAADADLGRGGANTGRLPNVFGKRYRVARAVDAAVCATDDVQPAAAGANPSDPRVCPPGK